MCHSRFCCAAMCCRLIFLSSVRFRRLRSEPVVVISDAAKKTKGRGAAEPREAREDPSSVPTKGAFFFHDDRAGGG